MPYLENGSLATLLARRGPLTPPRAIQYIEQAASALDYAHAHGIVHRDVKPSNLLLHPDGRILLADFGIAHMRSTSGTSSASGVHLFKSPHGGDGDLTRAGQAMGTPSYMAPEQVRGDEVTGAADIYALGIVAYMLLTGKTPFGSGDIATVLRRQLSEPPKSIRALRADIPQRVEDAIFWALEKDPAARPARAGAFARALREAGRSLPSGETAAVKAGAQSWSRFERRTLASAPGRIPSGQRSALGTFPPTLSPADGIGLGGDDDSPSDNTPALGLHHSADDDGALARDEATVFDVAAAAAQRAAIPQWPTQQRQQHTHSALGGLRLVALALVALVFIVVGALVAVNALGQAGTGKANAPISGNAPNATTNTPVPTVTPRPTATKPPMVTNALRLSTTSVSLSCRRRTRTVTLKNSSSSSVDWYAQLSDNNGESPVLVSPDQGSLAPGDSTTIYITDNNLPDPYDGSIQFIPSDSSAGRTATLRYSTPGCGG
jgi:serine/threonine-protein kinase